MRKTETILVTGGAGFIGSHLVDRLVSDTLAHIVVFDNLSRGRLANLSTHQGEPRVRFVQGDVRDPPAVAAALEGAAVVYHLAAQSTVMGAINAAEYTFSTNVVGTFNVLQAAARQGVRRLVFTSSREVYGEPINLPVEESEPLLTCNSYGASKAAGEAYCRAFRREYGLEATILRVTNVYGPRDFGRVIPLWLERSLSGEDLHVYGGQQVLDFIWIDLAVEALIRAGSIDGPLPPINVASGTGTRIIDLARRIVHLTRGRGAIKLLPARAPEVTRFVGSVERMRQILDIEPPSDPLAHLPKLIPTAIATA